MEISSMPYLLDPIEFGLGKAETNRARLQKFRDTYKAKEVGQYQGLPLIEYIVSNQESFIVAISEEDLIVYLVHLKAERLFILPSLSVTQVEVWRHDPELRVKGLASYVFFKILLKRYEYVVSDSFQTYLGKRFWLQMLAEANSKSYKVGLIVDHSLTRKGNQGFPAWIRLMEHEAWGTDNVHYYTRFVIGH
jgi:hypothetical protein